MISDLASEKRADSERESKDTAAARIARAHFAFEPSTMLRIIRLENDREHLDNEPIKLLEVTDQTIEAGIVPVHFGRNDMKGVPYRAVIVEVTSKEFELIERGEMALPEGWRLGPAFDRHPTPSVR